MVGEVHAAARIVGVPAHPVNGCPPGNDRRGLVAYAPDATCRGHRRLSGHRRLRCTFRKEAGMVGSRVALAVILGAAVAACASSPGLSQPQTGVPSGRPQITNLPDGPSPVAAPVVTAVPTVTLPASCVTPPTDINRLIDME